MMNSDEELNCSLEKGTIMKTDCVRDFFWVLIAFVRGKLLRQKTYRPQPHGQILIMTDMKGMTTRRLTLLTKWWGLRHLTLSEMLALTVRAPISETRRLYLDHHGPHVPYLKWNNDQHRWGVGWGKNPNPW